MTSRPSLSRRYRLTVASRIVAAVGGGYGVAWLWSAALALLLHQSVGLARADAALLATLASFLVYAAAVLYAFAARSTIRAWWVLLIAGTLAASLLVCLR